MDNSSPNILIFSSNSKYSRTRGAGGAETALRLIGEGLAAKGRQVTYFTNGDSRIPGLTQKKINNVSVCFFIPWRWPLFRNRLFPTLSRRWTTHQKKATLAAVIQEKKIKVVHTYNPYPDTYDLVSAKLKYNLDIKIMLRIAGLHWTDQISSGEALPEQMAMAFTNVDVMNFLTPDMERIFHEKCKEMGIGPFSFKSFTHDIGVDLNYFSPHPPPRRGDVFTIVCPARFSNGSHNPKRQDLLIEAAALLKEEPVHIHFAGGGSGLADYKEMAKNVGILDKVTFHGFLNQTQMKQLLKRADLLALPTNHEGVSKAVVEAMAMNRPVLASKVPCLTSFLCHDKTAMLVDNSGSSWAKMIMRLKDSPKTCERIANEGYTLALKKFNSKHNIQAYDDILGSMADNGQGP